jgi:uncharacterized protein (UPF0264 family)
MRVPLPINPTDARPKAVRLLVSVRSVGEAADALAGGADVIDVKEPANGPMGMAQVQVIEQIVHFVAGRCPVSAALGELADHHQARMLNLPGLAYVKLALAAPPPDWQLQLAHCFDAAEPAAGIVAAYADGAHVAAPSIEQVCTWACGPGRSTIAGVLIDTAVKDGRGLFHWLDEQVLSQHIAQARAARLLVALAGSLHGAAFERAVQLGPDIVAIRGAACADGDRGQQIDSAKVCALAEVIAAHNAAAVQCAD